MPFPLRVAGPRLRTDDTGDRHATWVAGSAIAVIASVLFVGPVALVITITVLLSGLAVLEWIWTHRSVSPTRESPRPRRES
ncbi:hypothetical protein [Haloferax sp. YSSS75]|uniref:hypothetical protein n=1 Tax=Haloferax sp. YSSS75 TaxID=3388564 RepID=UPI00398CC47A